ncbi:MAG: co-chaperone GroES [Dictyoglomus sp. NZ13-RE01]|nr:MAG: co-chaperone GroES [Dictyoglomus sp. NZ13-RE01]
MPNLAVDKVQPLDDRVLIERAEGDEKTSSGIYIPETARETPRIGKVIAVGTDEDLKEKIKVGDYVIFGKYSGDELEIQGKKYLLLQRNDILAIIRE